MKERLFSLIDYLRISPTQFADKLGIERSTLSHIKNDRSKPSLELVSRILQNYPEVSSEWLILGLGPMIKHTDDSRERNLFDHSEPSLPVEEVVAPIAQPVAEPIKVPTAPFVAPSTVTVAAVKPAEPVVPDSGQKQIERILVFYTDKTFDEYIK